MHLQTEGKALLDDVIIFIDRSPGVMYTLPTRTLHGQPGFWDIVLSFGGGKRMQKRQGYHNDNLF